MIEFAISLQNEYTIIFYSAIILAVILEGPISILFISLFAQKFGFSYFHIIMFAFIGDLGGDLLHFFIGKFGKNLTKKIEKKEKFNKLLNKINSYSLIDKLIVIKYTPAITNIGLLYLGSTIKLKDFLKTDIYFCLFSSIILSTIGYFFGGFLGNKDNFVYIFIIIGLTFTFFYFLSKFLYKIILKKRLK